MKKKIALVLAAMLLAFTTLCGCVEKPDSGKPVVVKLWHYYNGKQMESLNTLIEQFNKTVGKQKNVEVVGVPQSNINNLSQSVIAAAAKRPGAEDMPDMFMTYADTAYVVDSLGKVADLDNYFTQSELDDYLPSFIEDGRLNGKLKIFPIAKASELFVINKTFWDDFQAENPDVSDNEFATIEGVIKVAEKYYRWTDAQTPDVANDGKAFYSRDSLSNYFILGAKQLGVELMQVAGGELVMNYDAAVMKKLWDNYYVPYLKGYFYSSAKFRSADVANGSILAYTGSTASACYFPGEVIFDDDNAESIDYAVYEAPCFAGGEKLAVNQGAGIAVAKSEAAREKACCIFLKWFTGEEINASFSAQSSYVPVKTATLRSDYLKSDDIKQINKDMLQKTIDVMLNTKLYTNSPSRYSNDVREQVLDTHLDNRAKDDREKFVKELAAGGDYETLAAKYCGEENFADWLQSFKAEVEKVIENVAAM